MTNRREEQEKSFFSGDKLLRFSSTSAGGNEKKGVVRTLRRFIARSFKRILNLADLPDTRVYDLRHTCATLLLVQGVHPRVVMEILGHSQISLTMNTYTHVVPQLQNQAAGLMDDLLSEGM